MTASALERGFATISDRPPFSRIRVVPVPSFSRRIMKTLATICSVAVLCTTAAASWNRNLVPTSCEEQPTRGDPSLSYVSHGPTHRMSRALQFVVRTLDRTRSLWPPPPTDFAVVAGTPLFYYLPLGRSSSSNRE